MKTPSISVIIAAHREGLIAHKTILSVQRAAKVLSSHGYTYEIIVTVDNGDQETLNYLSRYDSSSDISVHRVNFGDLALSRNYGVQVAKSEYIATVDADDLISENWLLDGLKTIQQSETPAVLHTHYSVNFGTKDIIWEKFDSRSKEEDAVIMTWANRWDSAVIAPRSVFEQFPYETNTDGYGSEDWHFNSQTLAAGIAHQVVPETVLFVRRKDISLMTEQAANRKTVRYTDLLDIDFLKNIDTSKYITIDNQPTPRSSTLLSEVRSVTIKTLRKAHRIAKKSDLYKRSTKSLISQLKTVNKSTQNHFPGWLVTEWRNIHSIEKEIFPDNNLLNSIELYHSEMYELGAIFTEMCKSLKKKPSYLLFVPSLSPGGAELVALRYARKIKNQHPDWNIAVIATERGTNEWINRLPYGIDFIDFGTLTEGLSESLRMHLLARLIVQSEASHIHIAQSPLMFKFTELHKQLLSPLSVYAFAFCEDLDDQGRVAGHIHSGLPGAYSVVDKIFTDNKAVADQLVAEYAFDAKKFKVHYQPVEYSTLEPKKKINKKDVRILWASRIAKQKRPDLLVNIAKKLPENISIDMYGSFHEGYSRLDFESVDNLTYKGTFNGLTSIPISNYDIFLYTSENDGIPNIILEATSLGLPIISSNAGGISEFISESTGYLIKDREDINSYIHAIKELINDDVQRKDIVKNAQEKMITQHSVEKFTQSIKKDVR